MGSESDRAGWYGPDQVFQAPCRDEPMDLPRAQPPSPIPPVSPVARQIAELKEIAEELYCKAEAEGVYGAGEPWSVEFAANNRWAARAALDRLGDELSTIIRGLRNEVVTYGLTSPRPLVWSRAPEPGASDSAPTPYGSRTASPDPCYTEPPDDADADADAAAPTTPAAATAAGDDPEEEPQPAAAAGAAPKRHCPE